MIRMTDSPRVDSPHPARTILDAVRTIVHEHRLLLMLAIGYVLVGGAIQTFLGRPWPIRLMTTPWAAIWIAASVLWIGWEYLRHPKRLRAIVTVPRVGGALLIAVLALPVQITFQSLKESLGHVIPFTADVPLSRADAWIHGGPAWHLFEGLLNRPGILHAIDLLYLAWFAEMIGFALWMAWTRRRTLRMRAMLAFLLLWVIGGTAGAWAFPSAGPCYYADVTNASENPYLPLEHRLEAGRPRVLARQVQSVLWEHFEADAWDQFGGVSAMPSMHVGVAVLVAIVAWQCSALVGALFAAYAVAIQIGSVLLGWHYAIDGYAAAALAFVLWGAVTRLHPDNTSEPLSSGRTVAQPPGRRASHLRSRDAVAADGSADRASGAHRSAFTRNTAKRRSSG